MPKPPKTKRIRITLKEKRAVVHRYITFCASARPVDAKAIQLYDPDDELEDERSENSVKMFLLTENKLWLQNDQLDMSNVFKWIKAYERGEYLEWGDINDINKLNCRSKEIIEHLNKLLSAKHPVEAHWIKLVKSPSSPDQYGIIANTRIPAGTLLGFYEGAYFETTDEVRGSNKFKICANMFIDAFEFDSCYARYYNWSTNPSAQNVCVERLFGWVNSNRAICFISNVDIPEGNELILGHDQAQLKRRANNKRYKTAHSNFAGRAAAIVAEDHREAQNYQY
jgi:hypothetical protein